MRPVMAGQTQRFCLEADDTAKSEKMRFGCGSGHMAKVLSEYFGKVKAADIHPYGYGDVHDFLATPHETNGFDWVITNPPFRLGEAFALLALRLARRGVAMLTRTVFI